jgi:hypothetical protein
VRFDAMPGETQSGLLDAERFDAHESIVEHQWVARPDAQRTINVTKFQVASRQRFPRQIEIPGVTISDKGSS